MMYRILQPVLQVHMPSVIGTGHSEELPDKHQETCFSIPSWSLMCLGCHKQLSDPHLTCGKLSYDMAA